MNRPYTFKPEVFGTLTRFTDSPSEGDLACLCSFCGRMIDNTEIALRVWPSVESAGLMWEIRLHVDCTKEVIVLSNQEVEE